MSWSDLSSPLALSPFSALTIIVSMPFIQQLLYPVLRDFKIPYPPTNRTTAGFVLQAAAVAYAFGVQKLIYNVGLFYDKFLGCPLSEGGVSNSLSAALQIVAHVLEGLKGGPLLPC